MRRIRSLTLFALVSTLCLAMWTGVASAHVTVQPPTAAQGSYAKLTFRVPNERPDAATVKLAVQLPPDHPFASVSVKPLDGWTAEVTKTTLAQPIPRESGAPLTEAVSTITWTGGRIEPGQFQEFEVSVGPLPTDTTTLAFPAIQTYSSGEEVAWIQIPQAGQAEPQRPAPTLTLTAAAASGDSHGSAATDSHGSSSATETASISSAGTSSSDSKGLAIAGVVLGGIAVVLAVVALVLAGRRRSTS